MANNPHNQAIYEILESENRPLLSKELQTKLKQRFPSMTDDNARKRLSLVTVDDGIYKSRLKFSDGQLAYDLRALDTENTKFIELVVKEKPQLSRLYRKLLTSGGIVPYTWIMKLCACPVEKSSSKTKMLSDVLSELNSIMKTRSVKRDEQVFLVREDLPEHTVQNSINAIINSAELECKFVPSILYWLQNVNILSATPRYRGDSDPLKWWVGNNLVWDAFGFSETTGYKIPMAGDNKKDANIPCYLDIQLRETYTKDDLAGFYERLQQVKNSTKSSKRKILPILVTKEVSKGVAVEVKRLGILHFSLKQIFGDKIGEIVEQVGLVNRLAGASSPALLDAIRNALKKINDAGQDINLNNIRGALFEYIMCNVMGQIFNRHGERIYPSYKVGNNEYDMLIETDKEYIVVEVKGWKSSAIFPLGEKNKETGKYQKETLKWFFSHKYPIIQKHIRENLVRTKPIRACFITTSKIEHIGVQEIRKQKKLVPSDLDILYDGESLLKLLKDKKLTRDAEVITKYYIRKGKDDGGEEIIIDDTIEIHAPLSEDELPF